ncbi:MAG: HAD-IC family P-type ATPase [Chitinophagales bacterium]
MNTPTTGQIMVTIGIAALLCIAPFLHIPLLQNPTLHLLLTLPVVVWGLYYLSDSWHIDTNRKTLHNNVLWFVALLTLWTLSLVHYIAAEQQTPYFWQALAVFTSFSLVSLYLLETLQKHTSTHEFRLCDLKEQLLNTAPFNAALTIYAGDLIPIDGRVVSGEGLVNESALTGNNLLQDKHKDMKVWAGSQLELGQLNIVSFEKNEDPSPTFLAQSLEQLQRLKRHFPSEHLWMRYFNNAFVIAVFSWASMLAYGRYQALSSIEPALPALQIGTNVLTLFASLLIVVCPIALATVVPLAYRRTLDQLFQKGIRLQNSLVIKKIAALKSMIFSKTGVLTTGIFHIHNFHTTISSNDFKAILLALEAHSQHPFGKAIIAHFEGEVQPLALQEVRSIHGLGIMGKDASGNTYMAGAYNIAAELTKEDGHSVYVLVNNQLVGWLDLKDRLREEAEPCVSALKELQLKVMLLSGDREIPTQYIAQKMGIQEYHFQQFPEQKKAILQQIQTEGLAGMIVEHPTEENLLKQVSVGMTFENLPEQHTSNQTTTEVAIFNHRLLLVNELIAMCRSLVLRVRWISIFAIVYNISMVILASLGYFSLILAAICSFTVWAITFLFLKI